MKLKYSNIALPLARNVNLDDAFDVLLEKSQSKKRKEIKSSASGKKKKTTKRRKK